MKILFLTLMKIDSFDERGIYSDLLKKFHKEGHEICVICPNERREKKGTELNKNCNSQILKVKTLNIQKTSLIEKGIATLMIERQFLNAVKKYFSEIKFDLVLYSTPPITFSKVIEYVKNRDGAYSYLLLKDIFPQNAVDMKMLKKNGVIHKYFLRKEKKLYELSDKIGCLSEANLEYLKKHNSYLDFKKIEINPNTISPKFINYSNSEKENIKLKYSIPLEKRIFIYGGNLGKPQGLDFLLKTIQQTKRSDVYFLIIGSGTEFMRIQEWFEKFQPKNALLIAGLPKNDYDKLLASSDVGLIFLNKNFTIPNYPSRLLSYLEMKIPIIAATDANTDIGSDIEKNNCGYWIQSGDSAGIQLAIDNLMNDDQRFAVMKENAWKFLTNEFTIDKSFDLIKEKIKKNFG
jgi:glycosyltransferase involved in cell wall biosynthesis